jgi:hypothetical protein
MIILFNFKVGEILSENVIYPYKLKVSISRIIE